MNNHSKLFEKLRKTDFSKWVTTMWLVKRRLIEKQATYSVLRVDTDAKLQTKLKKKVADKIQGKDHHCEEYSFLSADQDDCVLTINAEETDFKAIMAEIWLKAWATQRPLHMRICSIPGHTSLNCGTAMGRSMDSEKSTA